VQSPEKGGFMRATKIIFRRILSQRWGAVVIVASLALGIGLNGAMYALFRATFVRPYAFDQGHRAVEICQQERGNAVGNCIDSWPDLQDLREASRSYLAVTAYRVYGTSLPVGNDEKEVEITEADPNFAAVTGVHPQYGRMFGLEDFAEGAPPVGILSDALWKRSFLGDPRIIGSLIRIRSSDVRVVGIMPPGFAFPFNNPAFGAKGTDVWTPLRNRNEKRTSRNLSAAALLKDGVSARQAQAEASVIATRLANLHPEDKEYTFEVHGLDHDLHEYFGKTAEITAIITALILILAVLNVNGILLAEHFRRSAERRLRVMLGATRWQLLRTFLAQSLVLSFAGGIVGACLATVFLRTTHGFLPSQLPHAGELVMDWRVLAFIVVVSAVAGVVSGIWPPLVAELRASRSEGLALRGSKGEAAPRRAAKARRVLVMAQVGGAMALLSLTGMLLAHMHAVATANVGFRIDHLVSFTWVSAKPSWSDVELLRKNLEAIPGVESVAFTRNTPLAGQFVQKFLLSAGASPGEGTQYSADLNRISGDYFLVMGIPLREGRFFADQDERLGAYPTVVVNEAFVRRFSPTLPVLSRRMCVAEDDGACQWRAIIGVAGDVRDSGIFDPPDPAFYLPWRQNTRPGGANVCVRTRIAPEAILGEVRKAVSRTSPADRAFFIETVENLARKQVSAGIVILSGAALAAVVTIFLAAGGLYGTLFNIVRQSRREIGIRMAMGATPSATTWRFIRNEGKWVTLGLASGVFGAFGMNQSAQAAVYGLPSLKPWVLAAAGTVVIVVSFLAVLLPLREAARLNPAEVLRHE
jgi:putative ABC transport system permease protein